ncbi:hypothetical protein HanRHA438_Chr14g0653741 [Helianthus annuus]|nr:hypothetical protein HanRHA438_Chr14g0653741 [Helianthus annuus]
MRRYDRAANFIQSHFNLIPDFTFHLSTTHVDGMKGSTNLSSSNCQCGTYMVRFFFFTFMIHYNSKTCVF